MSDELFDDLEQKVTVAVEEIELLRMEVKELRDENELLKQQKTDSENRIQTVLGKFQVLEETADEEMAVTEPVM